MSNALKMFDFLFIWVKKVGVWPLFNVCNRTKMSKCLIHWRKIYWKWEDDVIARYLSCQGFQCMQCSELSSKLMVAIYSTIESHSLSFLKLCSYQRVEIFSMNSSNISHKNAFVVLPQIVPFDFGTDEINAMDMVSASCTVNKGDIPLKITWMRNNQPIYSNDGVSISRTNQRISILSIESVRDRHSGNYSCIATNSGGSVNYTSSLWVNGTVNEWIYQYWTETVLLVADFLLLLFCCSIKLLFIFCAPVERTICIQRSVALRETCHWK